MTNPDPLPGDEDLEEVMSDKIAQGYNYTDWECPECGYSNTECGNYTGEAKCRSCGALVWVSDGDGEYIKVANNLAEMLDLCADHAESLRAQLEQSEALVKELELAIPPLISWLKFDGNHNHDTIVCIAQDVEAAEKLLATHKGESHE